MRQPAVGVHKKGRGGVVGISHRVDNDESLRLIYQTGVHGTIVCRNSSSRSTGETNRRSINP